jgi:hypothetical protein
VSGASVPATSTATGDTYRITTAGTSQSKTWAIGDAAIYDGSSGSWTQLTGWFAYCDLQAGIASQGFKGYLNSDGATPDRAAGIQGPFDAVNNPRGWVAGAATLEWVGILAIPTTAFPSGQGNRVFHVGPSATPGVWPAFTDSCLTAQFFGNNHGKTGNEFSLNQNGLSTNGFANREWQLSDFRTRYSGRTIKLRIKITAGTSSPYIEVDDVDITSLGTYATFGTSIPDWLASTGFTPTYHLTGYNWHSGPAPVGCFILGSLTDADRAFHRSTGHYPAWVVAGGSMLQNTGTCYTTFGAAITGASSSGFSLTTVGTGYHEVRTAPVFSAVKGQTVNISFTQTGAQPLTCFLNDGVQYFTSASGSNSFTATVQNSTSSNQLVLAFSGTSGASFAISNLVVRPNGALSLPVIQPIAVLDDATTIGGNQARLVGVTPVTDKRDWRISADTFTNGNKQVLEGTLLDSTADVIDSIEQFTTGTPTTTVGSVSAGSQYKASSALSAGINPATLVTRKLATGDIWVNSTSTAQVRTTITGHRAV